LPDTGSTIIGPGSRTAQLPRCVQVNPQQAEVGHGYGEVDAGRVTVAGDPRIVEGREVRDPEQFGDVDVLGCQAAPQDVVAVRHDFHGHSGRFFQGEAGPGLPERGMHLDRQRPVGGEDFEQEGQSWPMIEGTGIGGNLAQSR
jgi:hypothetical protein